MLKRKFSKQLEENLSRAAECRFEFSWRNSRRREKNTSIAHATLRRRNPGHTFPTFVGSCSVTIAQSSLGYSTHAHLKGMEKLGAYAMKRVAADAHLPTPWFFWAQTIERQTIEPTTACAAVSFPSANTTYSFLQLNGLGRSYRPRWRANNGKVSFQWTFPENWIIQQCRLISTHGIAQGRKVDESDVWTCDFEPKIERSGLTAHWRALLADSKTISSDGLKKLWGSWIIKNVS